MKTSLQELCRWCVFLLLTSVFSLLTGCDMNRSKSKVTYETVPVKKGDITQSVTATGTLNAVISVDVGSQISGRILALNADFNSPVKKGDVVAEIDPSIYKAVVKQSQGDLASTKAALDLARITFQRYKDLIARQAGARSDLDKAEAEYRQAEAAVTIREAMLDKANADLANCRIIAPVDGIVIARKVDIGQTVAAAMTTPVLFTVAQDISKMRIIANVSEADIGQVKQGQSVEFTVDAFPDDVFHGVVAQVRKAPATTANVVTYDAVIDVENPEQKLFPGMTAEVSIRVAERRGVLSVSNAALRFAPPDDAKFESDKASQPKPARTQRLVYLPGRDPTTLKAVLVKAGITDGVDSELIEGLHEGDRVVMGTLDAQSKRNTFGGPPPPPH